MYKSFFMIFCLWNGFAKISTTFVNFPDNFTFGASTSSYQIEGAWNIDGKGESIWDRLTHTYPNITNGQTGDDATKSYYLYTNDSDLLKEIGFDVYRFSISWSRILPNGDLSEINQAGIQHYDDVINDLLEKNIEPMVTMYHWDLPQKLQDTGGWLNSSTVDQITNYADILFSQYGDRVKRWITLNEPYNVVEGYYSNNTWAPSLGLGTPADYIVTHHLLQAHMGISNLYREKYKQKQEGKISISLNYDTCYPKTASQQDVEAVQRQFQFQLGIFAHPIFSAEGDYPKLIRDIVYNNSIEEGATESRLPAFTEKEISALKGSSDFFSLNYFTSFMCSALPQNVPLNNSRMMYPFYKDMNTLEEVNSSFPEMGPTPIWEINPSGFRATLNQISKEYNYPEIFITENGYKDLGQINDTLRIDYISGFLAELLKAYYYDKCKIIGYSIWSILDNFEWMFGYTPKFGIIGVDFNSPNRTRTRKLSSYFIESVIKERRLPSS